MDEGQIDPARTEATIQRSLDKAKNRRIDMTDNLEMSPEKMIEALNKEIERLRETVMNLCVANGKLEDERDELRSENKLLNNEIKRATAFLNDMTAEMADARSEIRDMNGRISRLRVEAGYD